MSDDRKLTILHVSFCSYNPGYWFIEESDLYSIFEIVTQTKQLLKLYALGKADFCFYVLFR